MSMMSIFRNYSLKENSRKLQRPGMELLHQSLELIQQSRHQLNSYCALRLIWQLPVVGCRQDLQVKVENNTWITDKYLIYLI